METADYEEVPVAAAIRPSDQQERVLAFLPIPSTLLTIFGSSVIIHMALSSRKKRKWSPYTRILLGMSVYSMISGIVLSMAPFLRPTSTSPRLLSYGNDATCSVVGFLNQICVSSIFYNSALALYFLLTARYGFSNEYIAAKLEVWAHVFSIGYPLACACIAARFGLYAEVTSGAGCWVSNNPECDNDRFCVARILQWLYYGLAGFAGFATLVVCNIIILLFVRKQTRPIQKQTKSANSSIIERAVIEHQSSTGSSSATQRRFCDMSDALSEAAKEIDREQARRLRLVFSQAVLYVLFFVLCHTWTGIIGLLEFQKKGVANELEMVVNFYGLFLLQAVLTPLQGFFNMLVYIRPKYLKMRREYPEETWLKLVRHVIFDNDHQPKPTPATPQQKKMHGRDQERQANETAEEIDPSTDMISSTRLPNGLSSSLTESHEDLDHIEDEENHNWRWNSEPETGSHFQLPEVSTRFVSSLDLQSSVLDVISEMEESSFEPVVSTDSAPNRLLEEEMATLAVQRWSTNSGCDNANASGTTATCSKSTEDRAPVSPPRRADTPLILPQRRMSPPA
eukprot:scaffold4225_cov128-Cylindrotheca_fusiformis.AAC.4